MSTQYDLETRQWLIANKDTKMVWTEEQVITEYREDPYSVNTQAWCQIMLAGILGSIANAKNKYPEMWI